MEKVLKLIEAMNDVKDNIETCQSGVRYIERDERGIVKTHLFIKLRAVADENGIEKMKYVARDQD